MALQTPKMVTNAYQFFKNNKKLYFVTYRRDEEIISTSRSEMKIK